MQPSTFGNPASCGTGPTTFQNPHSRAAAYIVQTGRWADRAEIRLDVVEIRRKPHEEENFGPPSRSCEMPDASGPSDRSKENHKSLQRSVRAAAGPRPSL